MRLLETVHCSHSEITLKIFQHQLFSTVLIDYLEISIIRLGVSHPAVITELVTNDQSSCFSSHHTHCLLDLPRLTLDLCSFLKQILAHSLGRGVRLIASLAKYRHLQLTRLKINE